MRLRNTAAVARRDRLARFRAREARMKTPPGPRGNNNQYWQ